jgi:enoyl-CoA hydratase
MELKSALIASDKDAEVKCMVLTGSTTKAFASGVDIKELLSLAKEDLGKKGFMNEFDVFGEIRKPVIAAVAGFALGGGCELAMSCDIIIAAENAVFGQPEIAIGTIPGAGGTQRLTRAVGKAKAMELILTGKRFNAREAKDMGLVNEAVKTEAVIEKALEMAVEISKYSTPVIILAKYAVNQSFERNLSEGLQLEKDLFTRAWDFEDRKEGMEAFLHKRTPNFKNN